MPTLRVYGARKACCTPELNVARCTVAKSMQSISLESVIRGKLMRITTSNRPAHCPLARVNRQFWAPASNMLWVSDFTYVATRAGFI
jgi:putative transposase